MREMRFLIFLLLIFMSTKINAILGDSSASVAKILGGTDTDVESRPWMGQLTSRSICGCSLISNRYALTAAHCVEDMNARSFRVLFGGHRLGAGNSFGVQRIIMHPEYQKSTLRYDAALLLLDRFVYETDRIAKVKLADESPDVNQNCVVSGWGSTKERNGPVSRVLKEAKVKILSSYRCKNSRLHFFDEDLMICASDSAYGGSCTGDSGGPLVCSNSRGEFVQHGIVSFGIAGTCQIGPGVYTDVSMILSWIKNHINSGAQASQTTPRPRLAIAQTDSDNSEELFGKQGVAVSGRLLCNGMPLVGAYVEIIGVNGGILADDILDSGRTNSRGFFNLDGTTWSLDTIKPELHVTHSCNKGIMYCLRRYVQKIPRKYIYTDEDNEKVYEFGTKDVAPRQLGEVRTCIYG